MITKKREVLLNWLENKAKKEIEIYKNVLLAIGVERGKAEIEEIIRDEELNKDGFEEN